MTRVLKVNPENPDPRAVREAAEIVKRGGLVVYPTDTVYGLGCDPLNPEALEKLFQAKERPRGKPVPVLVASPRDAERIAYVTEEARALMEAFWPGPLTIVLEAKPELPHDATGCTGKVGVRMPNHRVALMLIEMSGGLLVGTSANKSGMPSPKTCEEALHWLYGRVDVALDSGPAPGGKPSTVVEITERGLIVHREGPIEKDDIIEALDKARRAQRSLKPR